VSEPRRYVSPKREAQAVVTRNAILDAFVEQLSNPGRNTLSPSEAAVRAGVSVRTVHLYFPNLESQVAALSEWFDQHLNPAGITPAAGPDDLPRYFREIHANALASPLSRALATSSGEVWQTVRRRSSPTPSNSSSATCAPTLPAAHPPDPRRGPITAAIRDLGICAACVPRGHPEDRYRSCARRRGQHVTSGLAAVVPSATRG
jgi:AcrR family transcriptional regulator